MAHIEYGDMKKYYNERNGLSKQTLCLDLEELKDYFLQTFRFFDNKGYFELAVNGVWIQPEHSDPYLLESPTFSPSAEVYFVNKLQSTDAWPIYSNIDAYDETTLFTVIEILYDHIAYYDYEKEDIIKAQPRQEYADHINNLLKSYKDGFFLETTRGFIMNLPNQALRVQLNESVEGFPDTVIERLLTASKMYYRFDSDIEQKKKAINILADILEAERENVKRLFDKDRLGKKPHDKLIFDIVNNFNIRHNNDHQNTDYSTEIWYDWMMQYYTSVIIAYYKIQVDRDLDLF